MPPVDDMKSLRNDVPPMWLVARPDGSDPRVLRAASAIGAALARFKDDEDRLTHGLIAVWQLGNFPQQFDAQPGDHERDGVQLRVMGRPSVKR